ncbi:MAG: crossover junction endodeoxyribonuclease RuvC [Bacteroidota bacterium]
MRVLGIDPSLTNTGWVILDDDSSVPTARGLIRSHSKFLFCTRYASLAERIQSLIDRFEPDFVGIESPVYGATSSSQMYALFVYYNEVLYANRLDTVFFSPPQVKSYAKTVIDRPKGWKMDKKDMIKAAQVHSTLNSKWNDNVADAFWIGVMARRFWQYQQGLLEKNDLSDVEAHQFAGENTPKRGKNAGITTYTGIIFKEGDRFFRWGQGEHYGSEEVVKSIEYDEKGKKI